MKARELMIGDWVYVPHNGNATHYGRITAILPSGTVEVDLNGDTVLCSSDSVEPITITPEILEKNGFEKEGSWFIIEDDYYDVSIKEITDSIWRVTYCNTEFSAFDCVMHIAFIHELQHALRLCGIEKEIEL